MSPRDYALTRPWMRFACAVLDALGARCFRPRRPLAAPPREILVIRLERFGDAVLLLPALARLRQLYPAARITWLTLAPGAGFAASTAAADSIWPVPSLRAAIRPARARRPRFDLALEFHADPRTILLARLLARRVAGDGCRGLGFLLDAALAPPARALHTAERHLRLVESAHAMLEPGVAAPPRLPPPRLRLTRPAQAKAARLAPSPGYGILHPGCGQLAKRWPLERWQALLAACAARRWRLLLTGAAVDRDLCAKILSAAPAAAVNLAGFTDFPTLAALVARAAFVVAPDTGIVHLAHALGTPSIALYGPNDPVLWGYYSPRHRSLARRLDCSFCARARCPRLAHDAADSAAPCLAAISAAEAVRALESVLAPGSAAASASGF